MLLCQEQGSMCCGTFCHYGTFCHLVSNLMHRLPPETLHQDAVAHIQAFFKAYKSFVVGTFEQYLTDVQKSTTYGDHITLLAIAREHNVPFLIISSNGPAHITLISPSGYYNEHCFLLTLGYLPEDSGEHYMSISFPWDVKLELLSWVPWQEVVLSPSLPNHSPTKQSVPLQKCHRRLHCTRSL